MKIQRTIPPVAAPIRVTDLFRAMGGLFSNNAVFRLEKKMKEYFLADYLFLTNSGKASLWMILSALKRISGKRKVVIPSYTCYSVPSAALMAGLNVSICDIDMKTLDYDFSLLDNKIDDDTLCVVQNHLFGIPSDIKKTMAFCRERGVFVVEDAAQAMGVTWGDSLLGTIGDVGFFSLGRGKNITSGSGGIIITNSEMIGEALEKQYLDIKKEKFFETWANFIAVKVMMFFLHPSLYWFPAGLPFLKLGETKFYSNFSVGRLEGTRAGLLGNWDKRLARYNVGRMEKGNYIRNRLRRVSAGQPGEENIPYLRYPLLLRDRKMKE